MKIMKIANLDEFQSKNITANESYIDLAIIMNMYKIFLAHSRLLIHQLFAIIHINI